MKNNLLKKVTSFFIIYAMLMSESGLSFALVENQTNAKQEDLSKIEINESDQNMVKSFMQEAASQKPDIDIKIIDEYKTDFLSIYDMYKELYPDKSEKVLIEKATANILNKIAYMADESEHLYRASDEPDGYETIINYINDKLNPDYKATLDATKQNIEILKKNIDKIPEEMKTSVALYIEDMESGAYLKKIFPAKKHLISNKVKTCNLNCSGYNLDCAILALNTIIHLY